MAATVYKRDNCAAEQGMAFRVLSLKKGIQFHLMFTIYKRFWKIRSESKWKMTLSCRSGGKFPGATEHVNVKKWKFVTTDSGSFRHFSVNRNVCTNGKHDPGMKFITSEFCLPFSLTGLPT